MALLRPLKENTSPLRDPVELPPPMIESSLYSIVSDHEDYLEAALCLCTAIKANVLGIVKLEVHVALSLLVNVCTGKVPQGFVCA
ncbi:unnamed protein product [Prunus brigantina]